MKKRNNITLWMALGLLAAFALWTAAISVIDVQPVGPNGSQVGFAAANVAFHDATGVHMALYTITDWLGLVPVFLGMGFALLGLVQLVGRKSLFKVDRSILALGGFYLLVMGAYLFFESVVINYRPVLIEGYLEASYPSSTTLLVLCFMPTAKMQLDARIQNPALKKAVGAAIVVFTLFMVVGRLVSGVHWLTDIAGGVLLSAGLVLLYKWACELHLK